MNIDNLKIVVIPTETENNINQYSSVEEILSCEESIIYSISEYLIAQNNDILPIHFSFLIDIVNKVNLTYKYFDKESKIERIKSIIDEWGSTSASELKLDSSPVLNNIGNIIELVEIFEIDGIETIVYDDEIEIKYNRYEYEELPIDVLDEILKIIETYAIYMENDNE
jgi:hypothetical protein